ncbi:uncharacterized protein LOC115407449 [Salarias fasciatus]|uniref:uncharacterized protein LOC115407449 n=1 Tax=Salarias fasciatus TaxID=181472 RepID=UPI0011764EAD|nr:uncharacterized protein LOC115407449 [Salarias fasciatus]
MKSHHKAGTTRGPPKSVQFSLDPTALQSILLNEGVRAGGPAGMTPRNSTCPPGRGTSICTPQRVPVKKNLAGSTPKIRWNPQRVPNSRQQPLSVLKFHMMGPKSPYYTPGSRRCKSKLQPQEEVVQRLFDDREDEQSDEATHKDPAQASESDVPCEEKGETVTTSSGVEPQSSQVFIQAPGRESVIFFSSGTKLYRVPPVEDQVNPPERPRTELPGQKTCSLAPPAEMLRRRFPPLEEARMDHEVSTYTSQPVPAHSRFLPPRPHCGNPLASAFLFEESTQTVEEQYSVLSNLPLVETTCRSASSGNMSKAPQPTMDPTKMGIGRSIAVLTSGGDAQGFTETAQPPGSHFMSWTETFEEEGSPADFSPDL